MTNESTQKIRLLPTASPYLFTVELLLECETRRIGKLDTAGEGTFLSPNRTEKHLFKKLNALGVNLELLKLYPFRWVMIPYCGRKLWTSRVFLLNKGKVYAFNKRGFEPQVFLPLDNWGREKAEALESYLGRQGSLFDQAA